MSEEEKALRHHLEHMPTALRLLDELISARQVSGPEDAMTVFSAKQKDLQVLAMTTRLPEKAKDLKTEAARCSWAHNQLKIAAGRRKKTPRVRAKKEAK